MNIELESLVIQCRKDRISINLSHQISFFHGQIGAGKSTIVRLVDFCLGGSLEYTPAIRQEFISATLNANIGSYSVILERLADSNTVQATWKNTNEEIATISAPIKTSDAPIWKDFIYNLSDLLFYLMDQRPIMTRRSKLQEDTKMIRVSFRDFMWYCYLDQDHLDSSFFRLEDTFKAHKSRDVMRYVVGYYSDKLSQLETQAIGKREEKNTTENSVKELHSFLRKLGYDDADELEEQIEETERRLIEAQERRAEYQKSYKEDTHIGDNLRQNLRTLIKRLSQEETAVEDLKLRIEEQTSLRSELLSSKFKLARSVSIANILNNVKFDICPQCGSGVSYKVVKENECYLCHNEIKNSGNNQFPQIESLRLDIDSRIDDLENSISIHKKSYSKQSRLVEKLVETKKNLDRRLDEELKNYDSAYIANFRQVDREIATLEERLKSQQRTKELPNEVERLEKKAATLNGEISLLNQRINEERGKLIKADILIKELEEIFKDTLVKVGFPGVDEKDTVYINRSTWNVMVIPHGNKDQKWDFENAGSGGKKTLYNVCYILAVHQLAESNNLPLPNLLIIDTPMKNIGEDVNEEIFQKFYEHLYSLAAGPLSKTHFIIIDKDYILPVEEIDLYDRYMTPDDPSNPPLIPYYTGP